MRILIIGHPGSGKTYLANKLSSKSGIQIVDTDVLFDKHPFYGLSKHLYRIGINKLINGKEEWIIDGYHVGLTPNEILSTLDLAIYLNLPKDELKRNVKARYEIKKAEKDFSHWQSTRINNLKNYSQIRFQKNALKKDILRVRSLLPKNAQFIELNNRQEIRNFLESELKSTISSKNID